MSQYIKKSLFGIALRQQKEEKMHISRSSIAYTVSQQRKHITGMPHANVCHKYKLLVTSVWN